MDWKKANLSAIFKKGDKTIASNYRTVSLSSVICKVFESIIKDHLISYLLDNDPICVQQFGFMQGRSTSLQLLNVLIDLMEAWESNIKVDVIYLDFIKSFDTMPHEHLFYKISRYGIKYALHGWIISFFSNRSQCVMINGCKSESVPVTSGIPQGILEYKEFCCCVI